MVATLADLKPEPIRSTLSGAPISTRWDENVKKQLLSSRLNATQLLVKAINRLPAAERPKVMVTSSAIGYYGTSETREFTESGPAGRDFLADLCQQARARARPPACVPLDAPACSSGGLSYLPQTSIQL